MPDASLHTMRRIRTTLFNQQQRAIDYREQNPIPRGLTLAKLTATDINTEKNLQQESYIIPDSPFRRPPIISVAGNTIYTRDDIVYIYFNNIGGPVKLYTMITPLPTGLTIDTTTGFITGTALVRQPNTRYLIKAENDFGENILDFSIRILYKPPVISYSGSPFNFIKNSEITAVALSNSSDPIETVTGTLPDGLSLNPTTGLITGTPTTISAQNSYFITASNEGGSSTTEIEIQVWIEAPFFSYTYGPYNFTVSNAITPIVPSGIVGDPIFYVALLPAPQLPTGLSINSNTGIISGTPIVVTSSNEYSIIGSNQGPSGVREYAAYFGMEIVQPPPNISYSPSTVTFTQNSAITDMVVTNIGGPAISFSVIPSLPSGITLNTTTGTISGTPLVDSAATSYVVTATGNGDSSTTISITINPAAPIISYASPHNYAVGSAITPLTPTSSGGTVALYTAITALPTGLTLNTSTGSISGTPTLLSYVSNFTIQGSNITGTSTAYIDIAIVRPTPLGVGSFLWGSALSFDRSGSFASNFVTGVATDNSNNVYVNGYYIAPTTAVVYSSNISGSNTTALPTDSVRQIGYYAKYNSNGGFEFASAIEPGGLGSNNWFNNGITIDSNNNAYVCGRFSRFGDIYNSNQNTVTSGVFPFTGSDNTYGAYFVKFNSNGSNVLRGGFVAFTVGTLGIAEAADVKVDSAGAIYISGSYRAPTSGFTVSFCNDIQTGSNFLPTTTGTNYNTFLVKFNSNGSLAWGTAIGNTVNGNPISNYAMAVDSADNIYLTGSYYGNSNNIYVFSSNYSSSNCNVLSSNTVSGRSESYIVKFGSNGSFAGAASLNACNFNAAGSIVTDSSNNIYVSGFYQGLSNTTYIHSSNKSSSNNNVLPTNITGNAQYLVKFNSNLQFQMALAVDSRAPFTVSSNSTSVALDSSNNIYLVGTTSNNYNIRAFNSNQSAITSNLIRTGSGNASYMISFTSAGQVRYGTSLTNSITFINNTLGVNANSLYFAGTYASGSNAVVAYDSNSNYFSSNILPTPIQAGVSNAYLVKYQI
jgi:hypothetical protein